MRPWNIQLFPLNFIALCYLGFGVANFVHAQDTIPLPQGQVGIAYSAEIKTEGGLAPLTWRVASGELPSGLHISSSGNIEGTPALAKREPYRFVIEVTDSSVPPQSYAKRFSLVVQAAPLRIVAGGTPLKIVLPEPAPPRPDATRVTPPVQEQSAAPPPAPQSASPLEQASVPAPRYSLSQALGDASIYFAAAHQPPQSAPQTTTATGTSTPEEKGGSPNSPSTFVCIYEDTAAGDRFWMYRPTTRSETHCTPRDIKRLKEGSVSEGDTRLLSADENSTLVIVLDPVALGQNLPFNKVFISAQLGFGDQQKNLEVEGYSKIGESKEGTAAQRGMAFESARNVQAKVARMAEIAEDLLRTVLQIAPYIQVLDLNSSSAVTADAALRTSLQGSGSDETVKRLTENLRLHRQEISDISDYLTAPENQPITQLIAVDVLHMDLGSLRAAATQVKSDLATALDGKSTAAAANAALLALWDRNIRLYRDFAAIHAHVAQIETKGADYALPARLKGTTVEAQLAGAAKAVGVNSEYCLDGDRLKAMNSQQKQDCAALRVAAIRVAAAELGMGAVVQLKKLFAEGSLSLRANGAKAGNIVTLTVQAMGADGATVGIPSVWEIEVKRFGLKHEITDSLLFLYRLRLKPSDTAIPPMATPTTPAPLKAINFSPSPGVTLGLTYYKRGNTGWSKFMRGLAPGLGVNVSFMNFSDPSFDLSTGTFTNTNGTNVQVGTGVIYSIFDNAIQFTNGWNLNVGRKRAYFGIGFSFVKFTEKVAGVIKK